MQNNIEKYLIMNFRNARLFRKFNHETKKNIKSKDRSYCNFINPKKSSPMMRHNIPAYIEPITIYQISNMIHVLFNERPVPKNRKVFYPRNEYYFDKAKETFLRIDTPKIRKFKDRDDYYYETQHKKKVMVNSWNQNIVPNWEIVKRYIDNDEMFGNFITKLNGILNINVLEIPFHKIIDPIRKLQMDVLVDLYNFVFENMDKRTLVVYVFGINEITKKGVLTKPNYSMITQNLNYGLTVNNGIDTVLNLDGQIAIPMTKDDIHKFKTDSKGFSKLLDGGLVWVDSLISIDEFNNFGFTKVGDISTEKTISYENKS